MVTLVALSMAEVCSAYPTAGALYWWASALARRNKAAWAWFVGWFNFLGEVAVTAAIDFGAAITTTAFLSLTTGLNVTKWNTFVVQDYEAAQTTATALPPAQIFIAAAGRDLGEFLLLICVVAQFFCGMASVTANSRMSFAFSRDGAIPGSRIWRKVNTRTGTP